MICDKCDFNVANPLLTEWVHQIRKQQDLTELSVSKQKDKIDLLIKEETDKEKNLKKDL